MLRKKIKRARNKNMIDRFDANDELIEIMKQANKKYTLQEIADISG